VSEQYVSSLVAVNDRQYSSGVSKADSDFGTLRTLEKNAGWGRIVTFPELMDQAGYPQ
jgi:hypothetical protein